MYYGHYNEEGIYLGFYTKEIHGSNIPKPNIELSEEEWTLAITGEYKVLDGIQVLYEKELPSDLEILNSIREERLLLLKESDWTQLNDSPLSSDKKIEWVVYRQELRDFTKNCDIDNPVFPKKPN